GFGAGCIGRSPNGTFNLWHLDGGEHIFQTFPGCQFSVFEQLASGESQAYAMTTDDGLVGGESYPRGGRGLRHERSAERDAERGGFGDGEDKGDGEGGDNTLRDPDSKAQNTLREAAKASTKLKTYNSPRVGTYHALYPRSWYTYENVFHAELTCEQLTPIWADNYQESSYPVAVFVWTAHNPTDQPITLSIMLSWQNMVGWFTNANKSPEVQQRDDGSPFYEYKPPLGKSTGNFNQLVEKGDFTGCIMDGSWSGAPSEGDGQFCIATAKPRQTAGETSAPTIAASPCLPLSAASPSPFPLRPLPTTTHHIHWHPTDPALWQAFSTDGILPNVADTTSILMEPEMPEQLGCAIATRFTLQPGETLEIPFVLSWDLPVTEFAAGKQAYRRYTDFFDRSGRNAWAIAQTALENYSTWQAKIEQWQQPILDRADLPAWFKMALFNELYDLTSGGTLWSAASEQDSVGQFAVLECMDYRWYESLDVRLYGGFATLMLWPELEKSVIRAFARAIPTQDSKLRIIGYYYTIGDTEHKAIRKAKGATPHDLGAPNEHPWVATNYTSYQDCNQWKDLPSDFVIQVYRAFALTGGEDVAFLAECWPAVVETLKYLKQFDQDSDGIPENGGAP
ncbi:MAG: GH116 family glycosyl-hydrolase, partial [Cyanobacteria bacterium P01_G01_bin.38]